MRNLSYAASPLRRKPHCRSDQRKREGFRPPLSRVAGLLPRLYGLVTSPRLPGLPTLWSGAPHFGTGLPHGSTRTIGKPAAAANPTLILTLTAVGLPRYAPAARPLLLIRHSGTKAVAPVPIGDRRNTCATLGVPRRNRSRNETRFDARDIRLLEPAARQARGARSFRHRSVGHPPCARRHFHAGGRFR